MGIGRLNSTVGKWMVILLGSKGARMEIADRERNTFKDARMTWMAHNGFKPLPAKAIGARTRPRGSMGEAYV